MDPAVLCRSCTVPAACRSLANVNHTICPFWEGQAENRYSTHNSTLFFPTSRNIPSLETNPFSHSQTNPLNLWHPNVYHLIHKSPSPVLILSQTYAVNASPSHFLKIHFNIIFPLNVLVFQAVSLLQVSPPKPCIISSVSNTHHMPRPSNSSCFGRPSNIWWRVQIIKLLIMQSSPLPCYLVSLRPKFRNLLSNNLSLRRAVKKFPEFFWLKKCDNWFNMIEEWPSWSWNKTLSSITDPFMRFCPTIWRWDLLVRSLFLVVSAPRWRTAPHIACCAAIPRREKHFCHHPTTVLSGSRS